MAMRRCVQSACSLVKSTGRALAAASELRKTELHDFHVQHNAKMVDFAGFSMPLNYEDSIMESARHCRTGCSVFDVSHMCGVSFRGKDAVNFLEGLTVADLQSLQEQSGTLSLMTNEQGGVKDDSVITKIAGDHVYLVVNAGCREKDIEHFKHHVNRAKQEGKDVDMHVHEENGIIAVQGPKAQEAMQTLTSADLETLYFSQFADIPLANSRAWVTRTGYTGEDGFEVALPKESAESLVGGLLKHNDVRLAGLGARDSLRLEAGLCLYGSDLTEDITPVEAGLTWTIGKRRREKYDFLGGGTIKHQVEEGPPRRRFGMFNAGPPARAHSAITTTEGENVGEVTSGAFSPNLNRNIAMGYATRPWNKQGTQLKVQVRNKAFDAESTKMPFVPMKFHRPPEQKQ